jgi:hypothetical protein
MSKTFLKSIRNYIKTIDNKSYRISSHFRMIYSLIINKEFKIVNIVLPRRKLKQLRKENNL